MNFKKLVFFTILNVTFANAQGDLIFINGFDYTQYSLNDTGITWAGEYPVGNNADCTSASISSPQDCHHGRDVTHNDDSDGHAGFSFTKLDATGVPLVDQSVDYATTPWSCVKDNITGLVWEVKTTTTGVHNKDNTYQWGGLTAIGRDHMNRQGIYYDPSWNDLVQGSNDLNFCGYNNWRLPTISEISSIVNKGSFNPSIDSNYFPNTEFAKFLTSSPVADTPSRAWVIYFGFGFISTSTRVDTGRVRLVHFVE